MRILLVESFGRHINALGVGLKTEGLIVEPASTGEDAINLLRHYQFDLVLLNLAMPDMEGSLLISRIRSAGHQTPILALTSLHQARIKSLAAGADDVVEPDIDRAELVARIRAIVRRTRGYSRSTVKSARSLSTSTTRASPPMDSRCSSRPGSSQFSNFLCCAGTWS